MSCAICEARRPRRYCPGVRGDICTICCGTEREVTVDCPFDCAYLQEARKHEKPAPVTPEQAPNPDIRVTDEFVSSHGALISFLAGHLVRSAFQIPGVIDYDIREAFDALIKTLRTQQSGLYYETRPQNPIAGNLSAMMQAGIAEFRRVEQQRLGMSRTRDVDVLGALVFLQRMELFNNNGRRRGRAFLDFLRVQFPPEEQTPDAAPSLIVP